MLYVDRYESPIGTLRIVADDTHLRALHFEQRENPDRARIPHASLPAPPDHLGLKERLERYFAGELAAIGDVPVRLEGSPFERAVWDALRAIPAGTVTTYGDLAQSLGYPSSAARAVGLANGSNPIPIVVPCHRVIGTGGNLVGYGGGLHRKRWLLRHEGVLLLAP